MGESALGKCFLAASRLWVSSWVTTQVQRRDSMQPMVGEAQTGRIGTDGVDAAIIIAVNFIAIFFFSSKLWELTLKKGDHAGHLSSLQWPFLPYRIWLLSPPCIAVPANPILRVPRRLFPVQFLLGSERLFFLLALPSPSSCSEQL